MNRRDFARTTLLASAMPGLVRAQDSGEIVSVGVIGHTGRGEFGHGVDTLWVRHPETVVVAVADAGPGGLAKAGERLGLADDGRFADYRAMLTTASPDIVAVCPRHLDQHAEMLLAAIASGARGIYVEKPFVRTPAEADAVLAAAEAQGTKIAIAHRNRYHPVLPTIAGLVADGTLGNLLEIRGRGKGDRRGGAEDLWVLGSHVLNLMAYFGGAATACSAELLQEGKRVTAADVHDGPEGLGPIAGNAVHARYPMGDGLVGYFDSLANDGTGGAGFGLQLVGSEGLINFQCDQNPLAYHVPGNPFAQTKAARPWVPISTAGIGRPEPRPDDVAAVYHHDAAARDLIAAIRDDRAPLCDAAQGAATVEMICAAFASHRHDSCSVRLPLENRGNALAGW
ncbi:Gfo/Idh/MocA family oxidoreductase [soil metagenome]